MLPVETRHKTAVKIKKRRQNARDVDSNEKIDLFDSLSGQLKENI